MTRNGDVITFYSYKGGTGRSMALANVACLLARRGNGNDKVLMIDWDLEAPGLHRYFHERIRVHSDNESINNNRLQENFDQRVGLIDLFCHLQELTEGYDEENPQEEDSAYELLDSVDLQSYILETTVPGLDLMKAGKFDDNYPAKINSFPWVELHTRSPWLIQAFASFLTEEYRYVLVDSRTGFTDISGICTMLMPVRLVAVFTPNRQNILGIIELIRKALEYRENSDDLRPLAVFPLVSRIELGESELHEDWRYGDSEQRIPSYQRQFEQLFSEIYELPIEVTDLDEYFDEVRIQHVPRFSFGEDIAVLTERDTGRLSLTRAYEPFAIRLVDLNNSWDKLEQRREVWLELKPKLFEVLADAFNEPRFARMIISGCDKKLDNLVARNIPFQNKVYAVIEYAERDGWLDCLVEAAKDANSSHAGLQATAADILAGFEAEGMLFYQKHLIDEEARIEDEAVFIRLLQPYLETLQRRTHTMPLVGLDESGEKGGELALDRIFIGLNAGQRLERGKRTSAAAVGHLHAQPQMILLGDPGSGKSTLLRYVAYCLAGAGLSGEDDGWRDLLAWPVFDGGGEFVETHRWEGEAPVPVFVVLRDFVRRNFDPDDGTAVIDYVCEKLQEDDLGDAAEPLRELAKRGRVLLLLDGVDEVPAGERADVWRVIKALDEGAYGANRWVATCRVLSFANDEAPSGILVETLQPPNEEQIVDFIDNWYGGLIEGGQQERDEATAKAEALKVAVRRPALHELAQNPMLLTIMALVQTFRGTLPDERARLYQTCVETLLLRWQLRLETGEGELPVALRELGTTEEDLQRLLWEIAWEAHSKTEDRSQSADIPEWDVIKIAREHLGSMGRAEQFLEYTEQRAHLLVGRGGKRERVYSFPHRTFQEYLAACHLAALRRFARRAEELAAQSDDWREVLNLAAGTLAFNQNNREKAFDAVQAMLPDRPPNKGDEAAWRQVWLAGEMCATIGQSAAERDEVGREILPQLRDSLVALLENEALTPQQRAEAGDALGKLGDPRPGVCTLEPDLIKIPAGDFLYGEEKKMHTIDQPFAIARYPVTVAQFAMFVDDGGYEESRWWGGEESTGWQWRVKDHNIGFRGEEPVTQPQFWQQSRWHEENHPIVGVSWYEAIAYCAWLTEKGKREYRLSTEEEWERTARHTDGRDYPWGNEWIDGKVNSREMRINRTTTVGAFPRGATECGAQEMSGNVWEWTTSFFDMNQDTYVLRGGSWNFDRDFARVASRIRSVPGYSVDYIGFRVVSPVF